LSNVQYQVACLVLLRNRTNIYSLRAIYKCSEHTEWSRATSW